MQSEVQQYCPKPIHASEFQQFFATFPLTISAQVYSTRISTEKKDPLPLFSQYLNLLGSKKKQPGSFQIPENDVDTLQTQQCWLSRAADITGESHARQVSENSNPPLHQQCVCLI